MKSTKLPSWIDRLLGLEPLPAPDHVFGVEEDVVRYCRFARDGEGTRLLESRKLEIPERAFLSGPLGGPPREPDQFRDLISELVSGLPEGAKEASLVLPDAWVRLAFLDLEDLPKSPEARDEVLRWKLRRLVPFRVEDLRLAHEEVVSSPGEEETSRHLLSFASEALLTSLEDAFETAGVWVGQITSQSLALLSGMRAKLASSGTSGIMLARRNGYSFLLAREGEPILSRFKTNGSETGSQDPEGSVSRDLRLTRAYLSEHLPEESVSLVFLLAEEEIEGLWIEQLQEVLGLRVEAISPRNLGVEAYDQTTKPVHLLPLLGAFRQAIH